MEILNYVRRRTHEKGISLLLQDETLQPFEYTKKNILHAKVGGTATSQNLPRLNGKSFLTRTIFFILQDTTESLQSIAPRFWMRKREVQISF